MILLFQKILPLFFAVIIGTSAIFFAWRTTNPATEEVSTTWEVPLVVTPQKNSSGSSLQTSGVSAGNTNLMQTFTEKMMATYVTQKTSGISTTTMSNSDAELFVEKIIKETPPVSIKQYTEKDILIVESNDANTILYQKKLGEIFDTFLKNEKHDELAVLSKALVEEDATLLEPLTDSITTLRTFVDSLLGVKVPEKYAKKHLFLLQIGETLLSGVADFQNIFIDPIRGMQGVVKYNEGAVMLINAQETFLNRNL